MEMLETNNYKLIEKTVPFLGPICDLHTKISLHNTPPIVTYF